MGDTVKKILLATAIAVTASSAFAGAYSDPVVDPIVIVEAATSSASHDWLVPVVFFLILFASMKAIHPIYN